MTLAGIIIAGFGAIFCAALTDKSRVRSLSLTEAQGFWLLVGSALLVLVGIVVAIAGAAF